jgi:hypothetical protein
MTGRALGVLGLAISASHEASIWWVHFWRAQHFATHMV